MDRFSKYNPKITFLFFVLVIILTIIIFNPVFLLMSFLGAWCYKIKLQGKTAVCYVFKYLVPLTIITALFNMLFVHTGETIMFSAFDVNFTFESLFYGISQGVMLSAVILWFSNYSVVVTSERLLAVFGRVAPNLALIFSMVLSFIPRMKKNAVEISEARFLINNENGRLKKSISNFSALLTMTLEESIETANSMKARGFNNSRTVYSKYGFKLKDAVVLVLFILPCLAVIVYKIYDKLLFIYEPIIYMDKLPVPAVLLFLIVVFLPLIIDFWEDIKCFYLKRKI